MGSTISSSESQSEPPERCQHRSTGTMLVSWSCFRVKSNWQYTQKSPVTKSDVFQTYSFSKTDIKQWNDWHWQMSNRFTSLRQLQRSIELSEYKLKAQNNTDSCLPLSYPDKVQQADENKGRGN